MLKKILPWTGLFALVVATAQPARAELATTTVDVSAEVVPTCIKLSATPLKFDRLKPFSDSDFTADFQVQFVCGEGTPYTVMVGSSGEPFKRELVNTTGKGTLSFDIVTPTGNTSIGLKETAGGLAADLMQGETISGVAGSTDNGTVIPLRGVIKASSVNATAPGSYKAKVPVYVEF